MAPSKKKCYIVVWLVTRKSQLSVSSHRGYLLRSQVSLGGTIRRLLETNVKTFWDVNWSAQSFPNRGWRKRGPFPSIFIPTHYFLLSYPLLPRKEHLHLPNLLIPPAFNNSLPAKITKSYGYVRVWKSTPENPCFSHAFPFLNKIGRYVKITGQSSHHQCRISHVHWNTELN